MEKSFLLPCVFILCVCMCESAKINTPRVLLPWFPNLNVNFTFEIIDGGCYSWSLSRNDIITIEPQYEGSWGRCSRSALVSVSKSCIPPGSVIILAEEVNSGEILRGDVDVSTISAIKVISTTWKIYLEEAPEAFEVVAYDSEGNTFSSLEGVTFTWTIENIDQNLEDDSLLVTTVRWKDTDYEAPSGIAELESQGQKSYSVLLYGQGMGEARVTVCLENICTNFNLQVVASVVLTPAMAVIAPYDTLRYKVVRARAGRLTVQDISDTLYYMRLPDSNVAILEDAVSLVRGKILGSTPVHLISGVTEVATATLTVSEPHSIKVTLRPPNLLVRGEEFMIHCVVYDAENRALTAGSEMVIHLTLEGDASVELVRSNNNGTISDAVALTSGDVRVTAKLYSIAGRTLSNNVEGKTSGVVVEPLEIVPPELYVLWSDGIQEYTLEHVGGGDEPVVWNEVESDKVQRALAVGPAGAVTVRGVGDINVRVQLKKYPHVNANGRVSSAPPEYMQVWSSGQARVGRPHHLHVALTATHVGSGDFYNFHKCNCASFVVSLLDGPEPANVTAAPWITPMDGACCVLETIWGSRGIAVLRVSGSRVADTCKVAVRAAPQLVWPQHAAALVSAKQPVLALGESLVPMSRDDRIAELTPREGPPPHKYPDLQLFTLKCRKKGDTLLRLTSPSADEEETVEFEVACASHVSRIRLEPPEFPGNCSGGPKLWLRPGHEVRVRVTLLDSIGRELLDERGPKVKWEVSPSNKDIEYRALDRLFIETHPDFEPVPVPYKYYQVIFADDRAIGWSGSLTASIPEATASIQARVVAPMKCDSLQVNVAWEGDSVLNIVEVSGGSGRYFVDAPKGVTASVEDGKLKAAVPGPGTYDLVVNDLCIAKERQQVEVHIEEVVSVEVSTSRAVCVGGCVPLSALVKGLSNRYLLTSRSPEWRVSGSVEVREATLCGLKEGVGRVRAAFAGVWSSEVEVLVFPPLTIIPTPVRLPIGGKLQLRHSGGPPSHLATLHYDAVEGSHHAEVSPTGQLAGMALGGARVRLVAKDILNIDMAIAHADVEVVPISGLRARSATQNLLVGSPCPLWVESEGLGPSVLAGLQPSPRVTWTVKDPTSARLITTHVDDLLERSTAEGLAVRVIPLKAGLITIEVRARNLGKTAEARNWETTVEILAVSEIRTTVEGSPNEVISGDRLALAVGSAVRMKSTPRGQWRSFNEDGSFELTSNGEIKAIKPGYGVAVAVHKDDRNNIYRESAVHVEVAIPHYCTAEPSGEEDEVAVRLVPRNSLGRELLAPDLVATAVSPLAMHARRNVHNALGSELVLTGLDAVGTFMSFQATIGTTTLKDEIWVTGQDLLSDRVVACSGWAVCLDGLSWRAPPSVVLHEGAGVTLALLSKDGAAKHTLKAERPQRYFTIHQLPVAKVEFLAGEWPFSMVPLSIEANGVGGGTVMCTEDQRSALEGVDVNLPITCRTSAPHTAQSVLDLRTGQMGCSVLPANPITEASEVELCAEWGVSRACTRTQLLPPIDIAPTKVSLLTMPATFTIYGHPHALKLVKITTSPGLNMELNTKVEGEIAVSLRSDVSSCGLAWVNVKSKLTGQEERVEVERECEVACGTLLGAIYSILKPYLPTFVAVAAIVWATVYVYGKLNDKSMIRPPTIISQTVLPPRDMSMNGTPPMNRSRTWSRSPYASNGPAAPVYGDASMLPDSSFSPGSPRTRPNARSDLNDTEYLMQRY